MTRWTCRRCFVLNSRFEIQPSDRTDSDILIILESRGGSGETARNPDYGLQLSRLLRILLFNGCVIPRIDLLSTVAVKNLEDLALELPYPIRSDSLLHVEELRKMIQRAQVTKGQKPGASGGNSTKRIGIYVKTGTLVAVAGMNALLGDKADS